MKATTDQPARIDGRAIPRNDLRQIRAEAIRRVVENNESPSSVMKSMGLCRTTIYPWLRTYYYGGRVVASHPAPRGRKPVFNDVQRMTLRMRILSDAITGTPGLWDVERVQREVEDTWKIRLSRAVARRILADMGFYPGVPTRSLLSKADRKGRLWIKSELPKLARRAEAEGRKVVWIEWMRERKNDDDEPVSDENGVCCGQNEPVLLATYRNGGFFCRPTEENQLDVGIVALGKTVLTKSRRCLLVFVHRLPALNSPVVRRWMKKQGDAVKVLCCDSEGEDCCP